MGKSGACPGQSPSSRIQGCGGDSEGWAAVPAGRAGAQDQRPGAHHVTLQQQGFTQAQPCWSCGQLEGLGETAGLGQGSPRTIPRMTPAETACG